MPQRFKKFPRFTVFLNKNRDCQPTYLKKQFISLNPEVLARIAGDDTKLLNNLHLDMNETDHNEINQTEERLVSSVHEQDKKNTIFI